MRSKASALKARPGRMQVRGGAASASVVSRRHLSLL